jgi:23S rRNA pseudouridine1911/1915/1917 synthase
MERNPLPIEILAEDDRIVAVVKPAGVPTAHAPRGSPSVYAWLRRTRPFVGVVSRLDEPVSGVVLFAKTTGAAASLARQFRERTVVKEYVAVVEGRFPAPLDAWVEWVDTLSDPDGDDEGEAADGGREARLRARVTRRQGEVSLVEIEPATGRKHQIRRQLAARRCPIVGDRRYGARLPLVRGIALHSRGLAFDHPATGERLRLEAPCPPDWRSRFATLLGPM